MSGSSVLHIALQEGFYEAHVVVDVDGARHELHGLTTRMQIGLAETLDLAVPTGQHTVTVELPDRRQRASIDVDVAGEHFLGVDLTPQGTISFSQPDEFRYA